MKSHPGRCFRFRLTALILLALVPAPALSLYSATQQRRDLLDRTEPETSQFTGRAVDSYGNHVNSPH